MKYCYLFSAIVITSVFFADVSAQTTGTTKTGTGTTTTPKSTDKVNKTLDNTNQGIDNATYTADKAKKTFEDITKIFKPKTPNEALVVIPGIEFEDENLEKLADAIKDHKDVKKASVEYTDGTATINVILKGKSGTEFWSDMPKELKDLFKMKNKKDNSILVFYKNAVQESPAPSSGNNEIKNNNQQNNNNNNSGNNNESPGLKQDDNRNAQLNKPTSAKQEQKKNQDIPVTESLVSSTTIDKPVVTDKPVAASNTPKQKPVVTADNTNRQTKPAATQVNNTPSQTGQQAPAEKTGTAGSIDLSFGHSVAALADSTRFNGAVKTIVIQPDGKMIIGGNFNKYNDFSSNGIIRINADGNIDKSFGVAMGFDGEVNSLALQSDGKVIVGGGFTSYNGKGNPCGKIARLNADGSFDKSFNTGTGFRGTVESLALLPDGKILVGGNLPGFNNITTSGLVRLNSDGSLDNSFNNTTGITGDVYCIALLPGGKIFAGGKTTRYDKVFSYGIVKLNSDGTMDNSFVVNKSISGVVFAMAPLPNGKVIIAGDLNGYDKTISWNIMRLNSDGSFDNSFTAPAKPAKAYSGYGIFKMVTQQDGKILIGGRFTEYNNNPCKNIARLNADGSFDNSYQPGAGADMKSAGVAAIYAMTGLKNGRVVVAGNFNKFDETIRYCIATLNQNGKLENNFNVSTGFDRQVLSLALQKDGKIIAGGEFRTYHGVTRIGLVRLNMDGSIDNTYNITSNGFNNDAAVNTVALQPDGKIIAAGRFTTYEGISRIGITRLNADGSIDNSFYVGTGFDNQVTSMVLQTDGKIVAIGNFNRYDGVPCEKIVRLNADGKMDNSFQSGEGFRGYVSSVAVQPDGKIIVGGQFSEYNKAQAKNLIRLNTDGSIDNTFIPIKDMDPVASCIKLQPDGKIVLAGKFGLLGNIKGTHIIRLNTDGKVDTSFNWNTTYSGLQDEFGVALQADGKMIVYGGFTRFNDGKQAAVRITRLNANGSFDNSFAPGEGFTSSALNTVAIQQDGKIIVAGGFKNYNKYFTQGIVRILGK